MSFSPANYLRGLGWSGPGTSLQPHNPSARAKPITIAQKKTLSGIGKDRDIAYPWWEMVFVNVAKKVGDDTEKEDHHRTSTGIISPLPPPPKKGLPPPISSMASYKMDAIGMAKLEMARRQLYSGFLRGAAMSGTSLEDEIEGQRIRDGGEPREVVIVEEVAVEVSIKSSSKRSREEEGGVEKLSKEERRIAKLQRKESKAASLTPDITVSPSESPLDSAAPAKKSKKSKSKATIPIEKELTPEERMEKEFQIALAFAKSSLKKEKKVKKVKN